MQLPRTALGATIRDFAGRHGLTCHLVPLEPPVAPERDLLAISHPSVTARMQVEIERDHVTVVMRDHVEVLQLGAWADIDAFYGTDAAMRAIQAMSELSKERT